MRWKIYHADGTPLRDINGKEIEVHSLTYDGEWMGECAVTTNIDNEAPIEFAIGDYLIYRGERFELNYDPGKVKQGRKNALGNSFKYSNIKFNSLSDELARAEFLDVVLVTDNEMHYTALPDFLFYVESLDDLLDRLQANMDEQMGKGVWKFYSRNWHRSDLRGCDKARWEEIYGGNADNADTEVPDTKIDSTSISIQNQTVWDGLSLVNSQFDVNFIIRNREVFIGTVGLPTRNVFQYGKGNGLYEVNQDASTDQKVTTLMRAYGSEKNLPNRYYATLDMEVWANIGKMQKAENVYTFSVYDMNMEQTSVYFTNVLRVGQGSTTYSVRVSEGGITLDGTASVLRSPYFAERVDIAIIKGSTTGITEDDADQFYNAVAHSGQIHFIAGVNKEAFPDNRKDYSKSKLPNNMACSRLMLPGFPKKSLQEWWNDLGKTEAGLAKRNWLNPTGAELRFSNRFDRPWIESANADKIGVRASSIYFDTEDIKEKKEEIYPTIKEMEVNGERIDEIAVGTKVQDNGVFKDGQEVPNCSIKLKKEVNFDINALKQSDFSITMTDGMCAGRKFKVSGSVREDGQWKLTLQRVEDIGLYFPYKDYQISAGDHFVLSGIELPIQYVDAASERLLKYAIIWLLANDHTRYTYTPKVDEIFMAHQHDEALSDTTGTKKSLHDTLKEGDIMQFKEEDFGLDADVIISKLTIKEGEGKIPQYEISLQDDKEVGTIQKIQEQINAIKSDNGGGLTPAQIKEYIASEGSKLFLSKIDNDTAQKLIRFWEGIAFGEAGENNPLGIAGDGVATLKEIISKVFTAGTTGSGFRLGNYGSTEDSYLEIDRLLVRKAAEFVKLVIRELQSVGGEVVLTPASMKCSKVEFLQKGVVIPGYENGVPSNMYRCYFLQKDSEGNAVTNQFAAGDLLRCQTFNVKTGTTVNAKNRYYWRTLANVGTDYIDIYENRCDTNSDIPQEGDEIVQFGNVTDATRQSVIILSAYGDDSPSFKMYYGVDRFSLDGKEAFVLSRAQMFALADKFKFKTSEGETQSFAQILASVDGLQTTVTSQGEQIGSLGSQITQTATALRTEVSETYATKSAMNELQGTVDAQGNRITEVSSSITQTATNIALKVAETTAGMTNCIVGSALRTWDTYTLVHQNDDVGFYDGGVGGSRFARFSASGATANTYNGIKLECKGLKPSTQYTMSVWVRAHTVPDNGAYMEAAVGGDSIQYFLLNFTASEEWTLCKRTFTTPEQVTSANVALCLRKNGLIDVCRPMIEEGAEYHGWSLSPNDTTEAGNLAQAVKTTGIDIENKKITATADKFEVKNNRGETTASVSAKGVLEVNEGVFSGFIRKKITTITPDNIGNYSSVVNGYIEFDFSAAGSYVVFEENFYAKFGGSYPVLVLPFYDPDNSLASKGVTADEALKYLGQTFIVVNRSNTTLVLAGFGTVNKKGSTATTGQNSWIDPNSRAIVTCNTQNKYSASGNTFKVLWDGTIYGQ